MHMHFCLKAQCTCRLDGLQEIIGDMQIIRYPLGVSYFHILLSAPVLTFLVPLSLLLLLRQRAQSLSRARVHAQHNSKICALRWYLVGCVCNAIVFG